MQKSYKFSKNLVNPLINWIVGWFLTYLQNWLLRSNVISECVNTWDKRWELSENQQKYILQQTNFVAGKNLSYMLGKGYLHVLKFFVKTNQPTNRLTQKPRSRWLMTEQKKIYDKSLTFFCYLNFCQSQLRNHFNIFFKAFLTQCNGPQL